MLQKSQQMVIKLYFTLVIFLASSFLHAALFNSIHQGRDEGISYEYKVLLKKGAKLLDIKDDKYILIPRDMYAVAQKKQFVEDTVYILDGQGIPRFETTNAEVVKIEGDFKMLGTPEYFETYSPHDNFLKDDDYFSFENSFSVSVESSDTSYFNKIYPSVKESTIVNRFNYRLLYIMTDRFSFGVNLNYLSGSVVDTGKKEAAYSDAYKWRALNIGPTIRYKWGSRWGLDFFSSVSVQQALFFELGSDYDFSSSNLYLSLESQYKSKHGVFLLGLNIGKYMLSVKEHPEGSSPEGSGQVNSIGLYGGYSFTTHI